MGKLLGKILQSELWEGKRKLAIMSTVIVVSIIFRLQNLIDGHDFALIIKDVSIAFMGANLVKHLLNTANDYLLVGKRTKADNVE